MLRIGHWSDVSTKVRKVLGALSKRELDVLKEIMLKIGLCLHVREAFDHYNAINTCCNQNLITCIT